MSESVAGGEERLSRLRGQLSGERAESRSGRRMRLSRAGNTLVGAGLHAAARKGVGQELTDLEQMLLTAMGTVLDGEEITAFGRVYQEEGSARGVRELFPEVIASRPLTEGLSFEELVKDLPALGQEIAAQPNASLVRLDDLVPEDPIDTPEFIEAMGYYGSGITVVRGAPDAATASVSPARVSLAFTDFRCVKPSGELGNDEIYWTSSAGSDMGDKKEYESAEFGSIEKDSHRQFPAGSYLFDGRMEKWLTCNISCWEADHSSGGWYNSLRGALRDISDYCFRTSENLESSSGEYEGSSAWFSLVGLISRLFDWLLGLVTNEDDLVAERSLAFDQAALTQLSQRPGGKDWWDFNGGGGGRHHLNIKATAPVSGADRYRCTWATAPGAWHGAVADQPLAMQCVPALVSHDGKLHMLYAAGSQLMLSTLTSIMGGSQMNWTTPVAVPGAQTVTTPGLAVLNGTLYCMYVQAGTGALMMTTRTSATSAWSSPSRVSYWGSNQAPALAAFNNHLICVHRGASGHLHSSHTTAAGQWSTPITMAAQTHNGPSLAVLGTTLYCAHRGYDNKLYLDTIDNPTDAFRGAGAVPNLLTIAAPTLATFGDRLTIAHLSTGSTVLINHRTISGGVGAPAGPGREVTTPEPVSMAAHNDKLYLMFI